MSYEFQINIFLRRENAWILNYQFLGDILPEGFDDFRADVLLVDLTFDLNSELLPRHCLLETRADFPTESLCFRRMTE